MRITLRTILGILIVFLLVAWFWPTIRYGVSQAVPSQVSIENLRARTNLTAANADEVAAAVRNIARDGSTALNNQVTASGNGYIRQADQATPEPIVTIEFSNRSSQTVEPASDSGNNATASRVAAAGDSEPPATLPAPSSQIESGNWDIRYYGGATQEMRNFVFADLRPSLWITVPYPNESNPLASFDAAHGVEYGQELSAFCQQGQTCDFGVAARSYRYYTGDYQWASIDSCYMNNGRGCLLLVFNVGDVNAMWRDVYMDYGHTITGLYWHGGFVNEAIVALGSSGTAHMLDMLPQFPANQGGNCSVPEGCASVRVFFAITSGNEVLVTGETVVARPQG